ncbi:MAG: ParA family protein, partial [Aestuariibacter sp.]|nr:ParA family protein [Aestuariibacter sp.]
MKVVSVWNPKGGQGKSLICINVAAAAYELGLKPLVICQDPQGTATLFATEGHLPFKVLPEIPDKQPDADLVIIDHVAADWSDPIAPIVVMPTKPVRTDYATFADAYTQVKE